MSEKIDKAFIADCALVIENLRRAGFSDLNIGWHICTIRAATLHAQLRDPNLLRIGITGRDVADMLREMPR